MRTLVVAVVPGETHENSKLHAEKAPFLQEYPRLHIGIPTSIARTVHGQESL